MSEKVLGSNLWDNTHPSSSHQAQHAAPSSFSRAPAPVPNNDWFQTPAAPASSAYANDGYHVGASPPTSGGYNPSAFVGGPIGGGGGGGGGGGYNPNAMTYSSSSPYSNTDDEFLNEPPLLEELGVNIEHITAKTKAVLHPLRVVDEHLMDDTDLAGPLAFCLLLGFTLLFAGKLHFGYIYGFGVSGCLAMSFLVNLLSPNPIDTWRVFSILGYCLLPVNFLSCLAVLLSMRNVFGLLLSVAVIIWCTAASTRLFERSCAMREQRWLIAYPTALLYSCFVFMVVF